jgi:hypothetical protein
VNDPNPDPPNDQVALTRAATAAMQRALLAGPVEVRPNLDGASPATVLLGELARLVQLAALTALNATGQPSNDVEHHAAALADALTSLDTQRPPRFR